MLSAKEKKHSRSGKHAVLGRCLGKSLAGQGKSMSKGPEAAAGGRREESAEGKGYMAGREQQGAGFGSFIKR